MKRLNILLTTFLGLALVFASCEKTPVNEWSRFYGFTKDDIAGQYNANPDESIYEALPTQGVVVYDNATVEITAQSGNLVSVHVIIPGVINKVFSGTVVSDEGSSNIVFRNNNEELIVTVYKNDQNQIRLDGCVKHNYYNSHGEVIDSDYYGFDVIKED